MLQQFTASLILLGLALSAGCSGTRGHVSKQLALHHEMEAERHQAASDRLRTLATQRAIERERALACAENKELAAQRQHIGALRSKVSFMMDHRFVMSDLEVDRLGA